MTIDSLFEGSRISKVTFGPGNKDSYAKFTSTTTITMTADWPPLVFMTPSGGAVKLLLPAEGSSDGASYTVVNCDGTNAVTVREDSDTTTIISVAAGKVARVFCDGTTWRSLTGA